jgi:chromosome segregation ATPase
MSEINSELKRLKNSLEKLDSYTSEIGIAKEASSSVVSSIEELQKSYSESISAIDKELIGLIETNKPLIDQLEKLSKNLDNVDFPSRLDKIDATVAGINQGVMNLQGKLDNTERDIRDQIKELSKSFDEGNKVQKENSVLRQKEIQLNKYLLIGILVLVIVGMALTIAL